MIKGGLLKCVSRDTQDSKSLQTRWHLRNMHKWSLMQTSSSSCCALDDKLVVATTNHTWHNSTNITLESEINMIDFIVKLS